MSMLTFVAKTREDETDLVLPITCKYQDLE